MAGLPYSSGSKVMKVQSFKNYRGDPYSFLIFFINDIYISLELSRWADYDGAQPVG